jgi:hypothetical protein|tara:strand:+ start:1255 stop:1539 length:285 start_codon:yes stop_codon:yes gene_type:complete
MSLWNTIAGWIRGSTTTTIATVAAVVVEENGCCAEIFLNILQEAGCSKHVKKVNGLELFEEWYDGPCNEESIRESIADFKAAHSVVAAKMAGKL